MYKTGKEVKNWFWIGVSVGFWGLAFPKFLELRLQVSEGLVSPNGGRGPHISGVLEVKSRLGGKKMKFGSLKLYREVKNQIRK